MNEIPVMSKKLLTVLVCGSLPCIALAVDVVVTPQMMNKMEAGSAKVAGARANVAQKYNAKVQQVMQTAGDHGAEIVVTTKREMGRDSANTYYVAGPNGGYVEVSSSIRDGVGKSETVQKNITYMPPGSEEGMAVQIEIPRADLKAAHVYEKAEISEESKAETAVKAGAALDVAEKRGNVTHVAVESTDVTIR